MDTRRVKIQGFSLIELLIVVAIILIIAAVAVPNVLKARRAANEASAVASLRSISTGELTYRHTQGVYVDLDALMQELLIDNVLGSGSKSGYSFTAAAGADPTQLFTASAEPLVSSGNLATGIRFFFTSQDLIIRFNVGAAATASSSPLND